MGWREVTRKVYDCDNCGSTLQNEFEADAHFPMDADLADYDLSEFSGFATIDGKTYCTTCWHWCEGAGWQPVVGKIEDCVDPECVEAR